MVYGYPSGDIGQDRVSIFVNGEEKVAAWCKSDAGNVFAVSEREGI